MSRIETDGCSSSTSMCSFRKDDALLIKISPSDKSLSLEIPVLTSILHYSFSTNGEPHCIYWTSCLQWDSNDGMSKASLCPFSRYN